MISVQEALDIIHSNLFVPNIEEVNLIDAVGKVLAEPIYADRDFPPFNRVMMDGIAISYEAFEKGRRVFKVQGTQFAGSPQMHLNDSNHCIEIMTGAMLPSGTDTVIRYEDVITENQEATITVDTIKIGQNVHNQGLDQKQGELLIGENTMIQGAEIGILATVGKSKVKVYKWPKIAIITTGDELVDVVDEPAPYQIRKSNSYTIASDLLRMGIKAEVFHFNDDRNVLESKLNSLTKDFDVFLLSGGVSRGKKDYLPEVFEMLSIKKLFHKVAQRPGKPFWFGKNEDVTVFALPGNPVSTYFCFNKYFKSWLYESYKQAEYIPIVELMEDITFQPDLDYFLQVRVEINDGKIQAFPDKGNGSGDLSNLLNVNGFMHLPSGRIQFNKGEKFPVILFRSLS